MKKIKPFHECDFSSLTKTFRIMKITVFFVLVAFIQTFANEAYSQKTKLSLNYSDTRLEVVLDEIEELSEFFFLANEKLVDLDRNVSITAQDKKIDEILDMLFAGTDVVYTITDRKIILAPSFLTENVQQQRSVSGKVTDSGGQPLPGVTVVVKGTTQGTVTNADGDYILPNVPENATLVFSFVGMRTQEIEVGNQNSINITLEVDAIGIEEVVAIGYGTVKKATSTGAISTAKGEDLTIAPVTNVSNTLAGRLPGVMSYQRSGEPGNDDATIRIRGVNTFGDSSPLVVVDGVPGRSLNRIDASTIESITILKDASAAIYGSRAANGVILVTTKRGAIGKPKVSVDVNQGFNQPTRIAEMADASEYAHALNEIDLYRGIQPRYSDSEIQKFSDGTDIWRYPNTNWWEEVIKPRSYQNKNNISVTGGSENVSYFVSLGSQFQDGYFYNSGTFYQQYDFRSNIDINVSKNIKLGFDIAGRLEDRNYPVRGAGAIFRMVQRGKPIYHGFWPDGTPGPDLEYGDNPAIISTDATGYDRNKLYSFDSNLSLDITIPWIQGLSLKSNFSIDKSFMFRKIFRTPWYLYSWDYESYNENNEPILEPGKKGYSDPQLEQQMHDNQRLLTNVLLNYQRSFDDHNINFLAGFESIEGIGDNFQAFRRYFLSEEIDQLFAGGDQEKDNRGSGYENARLNYFGRVNYNYSDKYLLEFVWRYDGSYIFPKDKRFGFFPGFSLGWIMSEENFWKENLSLINNFKLRASWGQTGNDRINEWQYMAIYDLPSNAYVFGIDQTNRLLLEGDIPNPNVTWEVANTTDIGFDASFLDNSLYFTFDFFDARRSNILWNRNASVPGSTGLSLPRENIGKVKNQGFDFAIGYRNNTDKLSYEISLNGGYAKNEILFWDEAPGAPEWQRSTGMPIGADLFYEAIGIFKDEEHVNSLPSWPGARPGDIIFRDVNDDGKINGLDRFRNDKTDVPRFSGGLNIRAGYSNIDINVLFQGSGYAAAYVVTESGEIGNFTKDYMDKRWHPNNIDGTGPRVNSSTADYWYNNDNTYFYYNSDFIRLKNMEIGYTMPQSFNAKIGVEKLRVFFSGYNLLTWSPGIKNFDPEMNQGRMQGYPVQKVINFGVNLSF